MNVIKWITKEEFLEKHRKCADVYTSRYREHAEHFECIEEMEQWEDFLLKEQFKMSKMPSTDGCRHGTSRLTEYTWNNKFL